MSDDRQMGFAWGTLFGVSGMLAVLVSPFFAVFALVAAFGCFWFSRSDFRGG